MRKKGWKETEEAELEKLPPHARGWVRDHVNLESGNDLVTKSRSELLAMFDDKKGGLDDRGCLRTLIWQEWLKIMNGDASAVEGNLRTFWYNRYEPFCIDKDLLESDLAIPEEVLASVIFEENPRLLEYLAEPVGTRRELDERLGGRRPGIAARIWRSGRERYLQNLVSVCFDGFVLNGVFRFQGAFRFNDPRESYRIIGHNKARYIFFTEKEGLWRLCEEVHDKHGITVVASKGEPGLLAMEYIYDALRRKKVGTLEIGAITDYDPWGSAIAENFAGKMRLDIFYGAKVKKDEKGEGESKVSNTVLNGTQDDLTKFFTPQEIERGKRDLRNYSQYKKSQVDKWMDKTHGIKDEPYGIHVDLARRDKLRAEVDRWLKTVMR